MTSSPHPKSPPPKALAGRGLRLLLLVLCLALAAGWAGRNLLAASLIRHLLLPAWQSQLPGLECQFQTVETNLISRWQIRHLSVKACQGGNCLRLQAPSLTIRADTASLSPWSGLEPLLSHLSIELVNPKVQADLADTSSRNWPDSQLPSLPSLPSLPALRIINGSLTLRGSTVRLDGQGVSLLAPARQTGAAGPYELSLAAESMTLGGGAWPSQSGPLTATIAYEAGRLTLPALSFQESLSLAGGALERTPLGWEFSLGVRLLGSQGRLEGSIRQGALALAGHLADANLQTFATAAGHQSGLGGHLQADGELAMTIDDLSSLRGKVALSLSDGLWNGLSIEQLEVAAQATGQTLTVDALRLRLGDNRLTVSDAVLPMAAIVDADWRAVLAAARAKAEFSLLAPQGLPEEWTAPFLAHWQALALNEAKASLTLTEGRLSLATAEVSGGAGRLLMSDGEIDLREEQADWLAVPWSVGLRAELSDAAVVRHFYADWPATGGRARGEGRFSGSLAQPHLPFTAIFLGASLYGVPLAKVTGEVEWSKDHLAIDATADNRDHDQLSYRGTIDIDQGALEKTQVVLAVNDVYPYLPQALIGKASLRGSLRGQASLAGPFADLVGEISAAGDWEVWGTKLAGARLSTGLRGRQWSVKHLSATIDDALGVEGSGRVNWRPAVVAVDLDTLALDYGDQHVQLTAPGGVAISPGGIRVGPALSLAGTPGRFRLQGGGGTIDPLTLSGEGVRDTGLLRQLSGQDLGFATLDFRLALPGNLNHYEWRWQGRVEGLRLGDAERGLDGACELAYGEEGIRFQQCAMANQDQSIELAGHLPLAFSNRQWRFLPQPLDFRAKVDLPGGGGLPRLLPEWLTASGDIHADLALKGSWEQPAGQIQFAAKGLDPGPRLASLPPGPFATQGLLTVERDRLGIDNFSLSAQGLTLELAGEVSQLPFASLLAKPASLPGQLALQGKVTLPTLDWLAGRVAGLRRTTGRVEGAFTLRGPLAHPEPQATFILRDGAARGSDSLLVVRDLSATAVLAGDQLTINDVRGSLGGSPVQGSGRCTGVFGEAPGLDLQISGKDLLLYRADGIKIRADTGLVLTGTSKAPRLAGEIRLTESQISRRLNWLSFLKPGVSHPEDTTFHLFSLTEAPWRDVQLDLRIKAAQPVRIANNLFKGEVRPDLLLAGSGEVPYLTGVIYADSGRITLPSGRLDLDNGLIRFADDSPDRPQLELQASGQMMAYDITAQIRGHYDEPEITLTSVPPLASEDLLMLLLTGRRPVNEGQGTNDVSSVAVYFGRGLLTRLLGDKVDQLPLLDRIEVDMGRAVTQQGAPTVDARLKLADDLWKVDTSYYLTGEKDIWDYYNGGVRAVFRFR